MKKYEEYIKEIKEYNLMLEMLIALLAAYTELDYIGQINTKSQNDEIRIRAGYLLAEKQLKKFSTVIPIIERENFKIDIENWYKRFKNIDTADFTSEEIDMLEKEKDEYFKNVRGVYYLFRSIQERNPNFKELNILEFIVDHNFERLIIELLESNYVSGKTYAEMFQMIFENPTQMDRILLKEQYQKIVEKALNARHCKDILKRYFKEKVREDKVYCREIDFFFDKSIVQPDDLLFRYENNMGEIKMVSAAVASKYQNHDHGFEHFYRHNKDLNPQSKLDSDLILVEHFLDDEEYNLQGFIENENYEITKEKVIHLKRQLFNSALSGKRTSVNNEYIRRVQIALLSRLSEEQKQDFDLLIEIKGLSLEEHLRQLEEEKLQLAKMELERKAAFANITYTLGKLRDSVMSAPANQSIGEARKHLNSNKEEK